MAFAIHDQLSTFHFLPEKKSYILEYTSAQESYDTLETQFKGAADGEHFYG
jgi:hypothetical protein